jgi:hypothetical protein
VKPEGLVLIKADWLVASVPFHNEAEAFIRQHHYSHSAPNTSTYRHGLYRNEGLMVGDPLGIALWIPPTRTAAETVCENWQGVLALSRLACHPDCPKNAASFLGSASMRMIDRARWPVLLTYADSAEGHTGAIYRAMNFEYLGEVEAGDVWLDREGRQCGRKRGQNTFTKGEMIAMGFTEKEAAVKHKFVHRA